MSEHKFINHLTDILSKFIFSNIDRFLDPMDLTQSRAENQTGTCNNYC